MILPYIDLWLCNHFLQAVLIHHVFGTEFIPLGLPLIWIFIVHESPVIQQFIISKKSISFISSSVNTAIILLYSSVASHVALIVVLSCVSATASSILAYCVASTVASCVLSMEPSCVASPQSVRWRCSTINAV